MPEETASLRGTLETTQEGFGLLRSVERNYQISPTDPFVSRELITRYRLRGGEEVVGRAGPRERGGANSLVAIDRIMGLPPEDFAEVRPITEQTAIDPRAQLRFETPGGPLFMRVLDLMTPIGKGQRGLIVAPPRTGKTILLQQIAAAVTANHPEVFVLVLLIVERPEEVTEMRRTVRGEVLASSNDRDIASHVRIARLVIERAKRMVETGRHVLVLLDSLTRLGRAFNAFVGSSGRTMTGGLDIRALTEPKAMFGAARNLEGGGSLTIIASALIETGSRMDDFIFQEFKGTGNMELVLSRELANRRLWPAVDLKKSGTRKEELLLAADVLQKVVRLRRQFNGLGAAGEMSRLLEALEKYANNEAFLGSLPR